MLNRTLNINAIKSLFSNKYSFATRFKDLKYGLDASDLNI